MNRTIPTIALTICSLLFTIQSCNTPSATIAKSTPEIPFTIDSPAQVQIARREISITDYGAVGDAVSDCTDKFAKAIAAIGRQGGGRVNVPDGVWLTGPIELLSGVELHLADNAIILFTADRTAYPLVETIYEGLKTVRCQSPLWAEGQSDIAVTGNGIIDGQGDSWRALKRDKTAPSEWNRITAGGGVVNPSGSTWYPSQSALLGATGGVPKQGSAIGDYEAVHDFLRPNMVKFTDCERVLLEGVTFQNSPCWNIHIVLSRDITVNGITVRCPWYAQNGDGIDVESCDRVTIEGSVFDAGDDAICIKSGKDEEGRRRAVPSSNIRVDNCVCFHGHGGFVVGSEMSGGVENIAVTNCRFSGTDVGLRFKSTRGRGGVVRNIYVNNIVMNDIATEALLFDLFYGGRSAVEMLDVEDENPNDLPMIEVDCTTPQFRDITIGNVVCHGARRAMLFNGLPEMNVENITVHDCSIEAQTGAQINESTNVTLRNVQITPRSGAALMLNNVRNLSVEGFACPDSLATVLTVTGSRNKSITIGKCAITARNTVADEQTKSEIEIATE